MTEKLEPGYYQSVSEAPALYRWVREGSGYVRQFISTGSVAWELASCVMQADIQADRDALDALIAHEEEQQDWVELTPYLRCLRDGTRAQFRTLIGEPWVNDKTGRKRSVFEAYRMGLAAGREDG